MNGDWSNIAMDQNKSRNSFNVKTGVRVIQVFTNVINDMSNSRPT